MSQLETVLATQTNELDALKAKLKGLEDQLVHKENVIEEQKRLLEEAREASSDNKMEFESLYKVSNKFKGLLGHTTLTTCQPEVGKIGAKYSYLKKGQCQFKSQKFN